MSLLESFASMLSLSERRRSRLLTDGETRKLSKLADMVSVYRIWKRNKTRGK